MSPELSVVSPGEVSPAVAFVTFSSTALGLQATSVSRMTNKKLFRLPVNLDERSARGSSVGVKAVKFNNPYNALQGLSDGF